jgi:signal transduction histidine kinase
MAWGWRRRTRQEKVVSLLVLAGLTAFVVVVYVVVVLGGGALIGRTSSPDLLLSVLATAAIALAFDRVQSFMERVARTLVYGDKAPPFDVWKRFSSTVTGSYPWQELPSRMAQVLAEGTGARAAEVWLLVQDRSVLAATWPPGVPAAVEGAPGVRARAVRYGGEDLGHLVVQEAAPLTDVEERLFAGLADQAGLVLRSARLRAELEARIDELSTRAAELQTSRQRLVDVLDERRRVLERDIHDGAQQHLVALAVNLRLAQTLSEKAPERAREILAAQAQATDDAVDTLVRLSRGIYPPLLVEQGLVAALEAVAASSPVPVTVTAEGVGRLPAHLEATAYFACLEALQNAVKHAGASGVRIAVHGDVHALSLSVSDDGAGFDVDAVTPGAGLANLRDRVESVGGTLTTESLPGAGTQVRVRLPLPTVATAGSG